MRCWPLGLFCLVLGASACGDAEPEVRSAPQPSQVAPQRPVARPAPEARPWPAARRPGLPPRNRAPKRFRIRFFSAGHGDAALLRTPGGHAVLVDAGRGSMEFLEDNLVLRRLNPFFRAQGVRRLDAFVITHPHWDHFGDPLSLRRSVRVETVYVNADAEHLLGPHLANARPPFRLQRLHAGRALRYGRLRLEVLSPPADAKPDLETRLHQQNNRSLVIRATFGKRRFLLSGDLTFRGELRLLARGGPGRADVLKLGHHGMKATYDAWLRAVSPRFAVASMGAKWGRRFNYLPRKMRRQLRRHRIRLLRTDRDGDIVFSSDGEDLALETLPDLTLMPAWAPQWRKKAVRKPIRDPGR